jgi:VWFA-related protein
VLLLAVPVASLARVDETKEDEPVEIGVQERVEVRLVLIDVLVLDHDNRTVPGLEKENFDLRVSGKRTEIETLDVHCPVGATDDVRAERRSGEPIEAVAAPGAGRIVLVFDYFHMVSGDPAGNRLGGPTALGATADALRKGRIAADQIMVVSLGEAMRIETPFTSDRNEVLRALDRMAHDPMLYAGPRGITEFRFFRRLRALLDLMEGLPGRKAVVLFSGPLWYDGFNHDIDYARLSAMAATSRTAFYPVDTGGLRVLTDPDNQPLGGQPMLRRIADETGGRMTSDTNDLALGFVRAGRDLGCIYTLGFHERGPKFDKGRRITVRFRHKDGLRAVYPGSFVVRSPSAMAESLFETAIMSPESFVNTAIHADLEIGAPVTAKKRGATLWSTSS